MARGSVVAAQLSREAFRTVIDGSALLNRETSTQRAEGSWRAALAPQARVVSDEARLEFISG